MNRYASNTTVSSEASRMEIERTLRRYKADDFAYATRAGKAMVGFTIDNRQVRFVLDLPDPNDREFTHHSRGLRTESARETAYEQAVRQRWRALALVVKAKLEAVASGIATTEQEFLAYIVLPGGSTVYENTVGAIEKAYLSGQVRPLLELER